MAIISKSIDEAKNWLEAGNIVSIPTETVYGLAGNALNEEAVTKIFTTKERPSFDPLIVHIGRMEDLETYAKDIPKEAYILAEKFWPGALSILLPKTESIPYLVTSGLDTVAIRMPNHPLTLELLQHLDFPLAAPSANPFGYISPTSAKHVEDQMGDKIPFILDGGPCSVGVESTIVGWEDGQLTIYRLGGVSVEEIEEVLGQSVMQKSHSSSNPQAPGMLKSHYAPSKPFYLGNLDDLLEEFEDEVVGVIAFRDELLDIDEEDQIVLSPSGDLEEAARNLFSALRKMDDLDVDVILAEPVPNIGLGKAINDRLKRAAAGH